MRPTLTAIGLTTALAWAVPAVSAASGAFTIDTAKGSAYTAVVYIAGGEAAARVGEALAAREKPAEATGQVLLRAHDGATFVELTKWQSPDRATAYTAPYFPAVQAYWRRDFAVADAFAQGDADFTITADSSVQWSEFLLRDPADMAELSETVTAMIGTMASGGETTLQAITELHATNDTSIGLIGLWATREGFHVFETNETFGDDPYWGPYADNAHWMMDVVGIR